MPRAGLTDEHKTTLMKMIDDGKLKLSEIPEVSAMTLSTAQKLRRYWVEHGTVPPRKEGHLRGRPPSVPPSVESEMVTIVRENKGITLKGIRTTLESRGMKCPSDSTLSRILHRNKVGSSPKRTVQPKKEKKNSKRALANSSKVTDAAPQAPTPPVPETAPPPPPGFAYEAASATNLPISSTPPPL